MTDREYDPFKTNRPEDVLRMMAIAAALIPALDAITAAKKARPVVNGKPTREQLQETEDALRRFEDTLHDFGFEVVLCPAQDPRQVVPGLISAIEGLKLAGPEAADPNKPIN